MDGVYFPALDDVFPGVLVTPACDIEQHKLQLWTFVCLFSDTDVAAQIVRNDLTQWSFGPGQPLSNNRRQSLEKRLKELIDQRYPRYHWLPVVIGKNSAHVADFSCVTSIPIQEVKERVENNEAKRVGSLCSSWREQLAARYSSYMGRVGTTDLDESEVSGHVERLLKSITMA